MTEARKGNGLVLTNPIKINTTLANLDSISPRMIIDKDKEYQVAEEYRGKLKTKCPTVEQNVGNLSGGNQQKVLLAKWMFTDPDVLILDEILGIVDCGIMTAEDLVQNLKAREKEMSVILTGLVFPSGLENDVDAITTIQSKDVK